MTEPTPNLPLLRKILDHIDAHPEEWDQWAFEQPTECGTTRCVGGWANYFTYGSARPAERHVSMAREALGLTDWEGNELFFETLGSDSREGQRQDVQVVAERIAARAGEVL